MEREGFYARTQLPLLISLILAVWSFDYLPPGWAHEYPYIAICCLIAFLILVSRWIKFCIFYLRDDMFSSPYEKYYVGIYLKGMLACHAIWWTCFFIYFLCLIPCGAPEFPRLCFYLKSAFMLISLSTMFACFLLSWIFAAGADAQGALKRQ